MMCRNVSVFSAFLLFLMCCCILNPLLSVMPSGKKMMKYITCGCVWRPGEPRRDIITICHTHECDKSLLSSSGLIRHLWHHLPKVNKTIPSLLLWHTGNNTHEAPIFKLILGRLQTSAMPTGWDVQTWPELRKQFDSRQKHLDHRRVMGVHECVREHNQKLSVS